MLARVYVYLVAVSVVCTEQVSWAPVHAGVYVAQVHWTPAYIFVTQSLQGAHHDDLVCA